MRTAIALVCAVIFAGCASAPGGRTPADPEVFSHTYEFAGVVGGQQVSGRFWFRNVDGAGPMELNMSTSGGICRSEIRHVTVSRLVLNCGGIALEFLNGGRVPERSHISWSTVEQQQRRACVRYTTSGNGQRVCSMWGTEPYNAVVTIRGTVALGRASDG